MRRSYAKENPQIVIAFARAIMAAHNLLRADAAVAKEVLRARVKDMPEADADCADRPDARAARLFSPMQR